jgi:hypothetical protein
MLSSWVRRDRTTYSGHKTECQRNNFRPIPCRIPLLLRHGLTRLRCTRTYWYRHPTFARCELEAAGSGFDAGSMFVCFVFTHKPRTWDTAEANPCTTGSDDDILWVSESTANTALADYCGAIPGSNSWLTSMVVGAAHTSWGVMHSGKCDVLVLLKMLLILLVYKQK